MAQPVQPKLQPISFEEFEEAFESGSKEKFVELCAQAHPGDLAAYLESLEGDDREAHISLLPIEIFANLVDYLPATDIDKHLPEFSRTHQQQVLGAMSDDELVDLLQELPDEAVPRYLDLLPSEKQEISRDLLQFPEHSAGGRMTTAFAVLSPDMTIRAAIDQLDEQKEETEILSRIFVVDENDRLLGKVRLRDLTFNPRSRLISEVMDSDTIAVDAMADQEEAAQMVARYDLLALPVVNEQLQLLGVITHDDALEILEEESTEDMERASGIGGQQPDLSYLNTPVFTHLKRRFGWVLGLAFLAIFSGLVLLKSEDVIKQFYILSLYLPMVVAAGGNTGAQSATMVIRAMSLGELNVNEFLRVIWKELRVGLILGSLLGICVALQVHFLLPEAWNPQHLSLLQVAGVVGISLAVQVTSSTVIGAILPIGAKACRLDPAVVASPAITTIVDVTGMLIYFALAQALMHAAAG